MSFREKAKSALAWLGAALVVVASAVGGAFLLVLLGQRKRPSVSDADADPAKVDAIGAAGDKAVDAAQQEAASKAAEVEARHDDAAKALEDKAAHQANGLSHDPAALADALKSKARG